MLDLIEQNRDAITRLCKEYGVARLDVFGSASDGTFDPERSDVDLLVEFNPQPPPQLASSYFDLHRELEKLFGRHVDLLTPKSIRNRFLLRAIEESRQVVYAA